MTKQALYPLTFTPILKNYIWGGRNLEKIGRILPSAGVIAESWEIAGHQDGTTLVDNGPLTGKPLTNLVAEYGVNLVGCNNTWALERGKFPLLIKLLDANRPLSVQVHPKDDYARLHEGNELGKTEMWYIVHAEPDAEVIIGVKNGTTPENFRQAIENSELEKYLHRIPVKTGDHIDVPAGTLHAIMGKVIIAEIQQNSNTTYRVYDWNRKESVGNSRPLHVNKAIDVINFDQIEPALRSPELLIAENGIRRFALVQNQYFTTERIEMQAGSTYEGECNGDTMEVWGSIEGSAKLNDMTFQAISFVLLPATLGKFFIQTTTGAVLLRIYMGKTNNSVKF